MLQLARPWRTALLGVAALFTHAAALFGCQCADRPTMAEAAARADIVVLATPVATRELSSLTVGTVALERVSETTLRVSRSWKGEETFLRVLSGFGDCEYRPFTMGTPHIVFADRNIAGLGTKEGFVWVGRCLPTTPSSDVSAGDLNSLGSSKVIPAPALAISDTPTTQHVISRNVLLVLATSTIVLLGGLIALFRRRRSRREHYGS